MKDRLTGLYPPSGCGCVCVYTWLPHAWSKLDGRAE